MKKIDHKIRIIFAQTLFSLENNLIKIFNTAAIIMDMLWDKAKVNF